MGLIVQKYGGSSLADKERILNVARRIVETKRDGNKVIAIVSAMGKTTDKLIQMAREISEVPPKREMDRLLSTGEQISMSLLAMAIQSMGEKAISLSGPQAGIMTDAYHSKARIKNIEANRLKKELEEDNIIIVAGFQGENADYDVTTLGRGGSDTSAVAIAAAVNADLCEIFTDVDGVYSCDPRIVPNAKKLKVVSYNEMLELAILGAKVLQHRSVELAKTHKVAIHVMASFNLLWMDGYSPEISYLTREDRDILSVEDILRGYAFVFEDIREKTGLEAENLIREYKETYCPESQGIEVASKTVLAMILWKV